MIKAIFLGERAYSNSQEAFSLNERSKFGERKGEKIEYSLVEAIHLLETKKLEIFSKDKKINYENIIKKSKKIDKKIETKLIVYSDLRKKGYIVKSALKFGADFRVYDKGSHPGEDHAKWILFISTENEMLKWQDFAAKNRIAHSTNKKLLIALVDNENDVSYYEVSWKKT